MSQNRSVPRVSVATFDAAILRELMERRGWHAERLGAGAGISKQAVLAYAAGRRRPSPAAVVALARALDVATTELAPLSVNPTLHERRWHSGLTVRQIATKLGMHVDVLATILRGGAELPKQEDRRLGLQMALRVTSSQLDAAWLASREQLLAD